MRRMMIAALALSLAPPALAQEPLGCFVRDYSAAHLKKNPNQHVAALRLNFFREPGNSYVLVDIIGRFADQGLAKREGYGGEYFSQGAYCEQSGGGLKCMVECDGGAFRVAALKGDTLDISTQYFRLDGAEGCDGISDLAESGGGTTTYRLTRAEAPACRGVE